MIPLRDKKSESYTSIHGDFIDLDCSLIYPRVIDTTYST